MINRLEQMPAKMPKMHSWIDVLGRASATCHSASVSFLRMRRMAKMWLPSNLFHGVVILSVIHSTP
ncbi:MAG: hypothetical protein ACFHVJ_07470 [Aestuariibacter sp.]